MVDMMPRFIRSRMTESSVQIFFCEVAPSLLETKLDTLFGLHVS